ncbi:MAG: serine hydrolase [Patescibacteria group bacterium]
MPSYQKNSIFLVLIVIIAFGVNIVPRNGRVITAKDSIQSGRETLALVSLESQAALHPKSESLETEVKIGPETALGNTHALTEDGAFIAPLTSFEAPFIKRANVFAPQIGASIMLVADLESGTHYLERGVNRHWPIASITKLMTATIASEVFASSTAISVTKESFLKDPGAGSLYVKVDESYRALDLIRIMLTASDNVAAEALAYAYGRENFMKKMNEQAKQWGMSQTYYYDPSGLSPVNQSSGADLEKLAFRIFNRKGDVLSLSREAGVTVTELSAKRQYRVLPINMYAGRSDFLGGKTGFIDEAGGNLFSIFRVKGRPILIVVLNSSARFDDTTTLLAWFKDNYE